MATPMSPSTLVKKLRAAGLKVVEMPGWRDNNRNHKGSWGPVHGVMLHHTVTKGATKTDTDNTVNLCFRGHSALPGPLCHGVIAKDGTVYLVGNGRANHAGLGDDDVLAAVIAERPLPADNEANTDGNAHFYGFECINLGDGKDPWPKAQVDAMIKASAAICKHHEWGERSVIGHLEWQPGKIDPRGPGWPGMDAARTRIKAELKPPATKPPVTPPKENPAVLRASLLARKEVLSVPAGEDRKLYFTEDDQYDDPNQHGANGYTVLSSPATFTGTVYVHCPEAVSGAEEVNVVTWYENADGEAGGSITQSVIPLPAAGTGADWRSVSVTGVLPAGRKLVFGIRNSGTATLVVPRVDLRLVSTAR
jgi:hypothetical protein